MLDAPLSVQSLYLMHIYSSSPQAKQFAKWLSNEKQRRIELQGLKASAPAIFFANVAQKMPPTVFILPDVDEAGYFYQDLCQLLGEEVVHFLPSSYRRAIKYAQRDEANEILRTEALAALSLADTQFVVTHPEAICELVTAKKEVDSHTISVAVGQSIGFSALQNRLLQEHFQETDYVYEPGQFAVRGSIIDVYSFSNEQPFRIDFFGDEVDSIRPFEVETQLSSGKRDSVQIIPELSQQPSSKVPFFSFLPENTLLVMKNRADVCDAAQKIWDDGFSDQAIQDRLADATEQEQQSITDQLRSEKQLVNPTRFKSDMDHFKTVEMRAANTTTLTDSPKSDDAVISFSTSPQPLFHKNIQLLRDSLSDLQLQGYQINILAENLKQQERIKEILKAGDDHLTTPLETAIQWKDFQLSAGFIDHQLCTAVFTDHQIFDRFHKYTLHTQGARAGKMALTMKELQQMEIGDYIVHVDFGIGKFAGLVRIPTGDSYQEAIRIVYQHNDKVDVSIHSLYKISKYRGNDTGEPPRLSILGSGAWERLKERTKKKIKDIARDLIKLYARRRHEKGFAFSPDTFMQHQLEASFLYEDTPDQLKATQDVKADMESARPMDRLVCGDVGFGKTEIAVRAAFKAACDGKQTALLVPTTVLAFQHYQTFRDRLRDLPVRVDYLSRARTSRQVHQVLDDLSAGRIDILVGTHKMIGKTVKWHDLGLLIIDEEQKFGVAVKEKLRKLKTNVDTLTMSATPIPRTLQFSLMGARDMSILRTPPANRYPIHTEIATYGHEIIADAINFEMSRNGQVFFVNNRISNLIEIRNLIVKYVPDCRVAIGHGQMNPEELEAIVMGFMNYDYDVLLSTTIVENGIDIPNANTIIINDAHKFGLSDLHQMRGRVGRSNKKAFCYLLAPPKSLLKADARRRLEAIETFSELGSGFNIAMQDLDLRGAGNLLGAEQSGFMEDLGYETYQKILAQAVTELRNDEFSDLYSEDIAQGKDISGDEFVEDCAIDSDLEMYFPESYVPGSAERMLLYRELDNITNDAELDAYRKRLQDRFGQIPREGEELLQVVSLRRLGKHLGCEKIILRRGVMNMQFVSNAQSPFYQSKAFGNVLDYAAHNVKRCSIREVKGRRLMHIDNVKTVGEAVYILRNIG